MKQDKAGNNMLHRLRRGLSWACSHNEHPGCPGGSCKCWCHRM